MSNNKQQTAVGWLEERLILSFGDELKPLIGFFIIAKEMEEERELNAYANGQADTLLMLKQKVSRIKDIPTEFNQIISENFWDLT